MRLVSFFALAAFALAGCTAENAGESSDTSALSASHDSAFLPYVDRDVVAQRIAAFQERNGASWEAAFVGDQRRFIASPGSMTSKAPVGPLKTITRDDARDVAREFFAKNADLLSVEPSAIASNLTVFRNADGLGGDTYLGWYVTLATPKPPVALHPDTSSYSSALAVNIDVDGLVHQLTDAPDRMPATPFGLDARYQALDGEMTRTFLGRHVEKTGQECDPSTLQMVTVTKDFGTIAEADLHATPVLHALPKDNGVELHLAYLYRIDRVGFTETVDATTAEVFAKFEPMWFFGSFGACW